jgi:FlaA1/EpsC-like NDP-sugar epimerase
LSHEIRREWHWQMTTNMRTNCVLVTGAGGSIGAELVRVLLTITTSHIVLLEASEQNLHQVDLNLRRIDGQGRFSSVLGDISDEPLITELFARYDVGCIFHTAAFKHVALLESNPLAALKNNAVGTWKLARQVCHHHVPKLVMISTDKAVEAVSVMGASKRAAEIALLMLGNRRSQMIALRLGNVYGSRGSVIPIFREQIARGGPVTVTSPHTSRYFFSQKEAIDLILRAADLDVSGILIPELEPPLNVLALAKELIANSETPLNVDVPITFTGLRAGEKLTERFLSAAEERELTSDPKLFLVKSTIPDEELLQALWVELEAKIACRDVAGTMSALQGIVTDYKPSKTVDDSRFRMASLDACRSRTS